jgi:hypothetical protein
MKSSSVASTSLPIKYMPAVEEEAAMSSDTLAQLLFTLSSRKTSQTSQSTMRGRLH